MAAEEKEIVGGPTLLRVRGLRKSYTRRSAFWRMSKPLLAVDGVDFEIHAGKTLALIGRSGSGKSTIARCITRLETPDSGEVLMNGTNIARLSLTELRPYRSQMQMIFQDASTAINPRFSAEEVIEEPLLIQEQYSREDRRERVRELMKEVGLTPAWAARRAMSFSGGQRQRLTIARALTLAPKLLVLDEALTGLDLSTQAQIANLFLELQSRYSLTYVLISHDLALVSKMADTIAVMSEGTIVERGAVQAVISDPKHTQTKALVASASALEKNLGMALGAHA